jgi:hypothetical protein
MSRFGGNSACLQRDINNLAIIRSRSSAVGVVTGYRLGDGEVGVLVPVGSRIFSSQNSPDRLWGSPNLLSNRNRGLSSGVKQQEREADHSPPASTEVKKNTFTPPYAFIR